MIMPLRLDPERDPDLQLARQLLPREGFLQLLNYLKAKREREKEETVAEVLSREDQNVYRVKTRAAARNVRRCKGWGCGAKLSIYNPGTRCQPCQLKVDAADLARRVREQGRPLG